MSNTVTVHKNRTTIVRVSLGIDVSSDTVTSQIRSQPDVAAPLLAEWDVAFVTDGSDGEIDLTIDDIVSGQIQATTGFMDMKRISAGQALPVFDKPLEVLFQTSVTA